MLFKDLSCNLEHIIIQAFEEVAKPLKFVKHVLEIMTKPIFTFLLQFITILNKGLF